MITYIKNFLSSNTGIETIEWLAIVAIAAILIGIAATVGTNVQDKLTNVAGYL